MAKTRLTAAQLERLTGPTRRRRPVRSPRKALLILIMWLTPGLPPPGPFG